VLPDEAAIYAAMRPKRTRMVAAVPVVSLPEPEAVPIPRRWSMLLRTSYHIMGFAGANIELPRTYVPYSRMEISTASASILVSRVSVFISVVCHLSMPCCCKTHIASLVLTIEKTRFRAQDWITCVRLQTDDQEKEFIRILGFWSIRVQVESSTTVLFPHAGLVSADYAK